MPFGLVCENTKHAINVGGIIRVAVNFGASIVYVIGRRYRRDAADTMNGCGVLPVIHCLDWDDYRIHAPRGWIPVVVEIGDGAVSLEQFAHPKRCMYIVGPEDGSVSVRARRGAAVVSVPTLRCLNVAVCAGIVVWDRIRAELAPVPSEDT